MKRRISRGGKFWKSHDSSWCEIKWLMMIFIVKQIFTEKCQN